MSICLRWRSEVPCVILRARGWNGKAKADAVVVASAIDARIIAGQKLSKVERDSEDWTASTQQSRGYVHLSESLLQMQRITRNTKDKRAMGSAHHPHLHKRRDSNFIQS